MFDTDMYDIGLTSISLSLLLFFLLLPFTFPPQCFALFLLLLLFFFSSSSFILFSLFFLRPSSSSFLVPNGFAHPSSSLNAPALFFLPLPSSSFFVHKKNPFSTFFLTFTTQQTPQTFIKSVRSFPQKKQDGLFCVLISHFSLASTPLSKKPLIHPKLTV